MDAEELNLTVHHFRHCETDDASSPSQQQLLANAARLVLSSTRQTKWYAPKKPDNEKFMPRRPCFQFSATAPKRPKLELDSLLGSSPVLEEWNTDSAYGAEGETYVVPEFEEFDHSSLHRLLDPAAISKYNTGQANEQCIRLSDDDNVLMNAEPRLKRRNETLVSSRPSKRQRLDNSSLRGVLPLPHFYPPLSVPDDSLSAELRSSSFPAPGGVLPIPPYTADSAEAYIRDPLARSAWVIPVRGRVRWEGATSASVVAPALGADSSNSDQPCLQVSDSDGASEIIWTKGALEAFWEFLKMLRKAGQLGSLSLSFHAGRPPSSMGSAEQFSYAGSHKQSTPSKSIVASIPNSTTEDLSGNTRPSLRATDHFKVYHDVRYTKTVRTILHLWTYRLGGKKIRLLKGVRLVLIDERSRGILLC